MNALGWAMTGLRARMSMLIGLVGLCSLVGLPAIAAHAASVTNQNGEPHTLAVTEDGVKSELVVGAGETLTFCLTGCFITLPNGDRAALAGPESVELVGDGAIINR